MQNKLGRYYGYFAETEELQWEYYADRAKKAGADCIEMSALSLSKLPENRQLRIADIVKDLDLELTFATALLPGCDFCSSDPQQRQNAVDQLLAHIHLAQKMGAKKIGGILETRGKDFPVGIAFSRKEKLKNAVKPLRTVGNMAAENGIVFGIEAVNRFECPLINTIDEGLQFVEEIDSRGVGLHIDTFHMNIEEDDPAEAIRQAGARICHVHFAENNRRLPGNAHVDWMSILRAINDVNYTGSIVFEALAKPYGEFSDRLNIWRNNIRYSMDEDLKISFDYIKALMAMI